MGWELINEPKIEPGKFKPWLRETARYLKSLDPNHAVGVAIGGSETEWWRSGSVNWRELDTPELDFIDLHYYADASNYNPVSPANVSNLKDRIRSAMALGKAVIIGEFGCLNTVELETMRNLYRTILDTSFSEGAAGCLFYAWGPPGKNGWGGRGGYDLYTTDGELCRLLKSFQY